MKTKLKDALAAARRIGQMKGLETPAIGIGTAHGKIVYFCTRSGATRWSDFYDPTGKDSVVFPSISAVNSSMKDMELIYGEIDSYVTDRKGILA